MNNYRYIYRKEYFGYTKFNVETLNHEFVDKIDESDNFRLIELGSNKIINDGLLVNPIRVYFETTLNCNLKCNYCFNNCNSRGDLSTSDFIKILDILHKNGIIDVRYTGGEFTTRKDIFDILKYTKELGLIFSINTNGVFTNKINNYLIQRSPNQVTFSVEGDQAFHDSIRGKGTYAILSRNMKILHENGINLRINYVLRKKNIPYLHNAIDLAQKYCSEVNFFGLRPIGLKNSSSDCISFFEFSQISKYLSKIKIKGLNILYGHNVMKNNSINLNKFNLRIGSPDFTTRFNIDVQGNMYSGGYLSHISDSLVLGNILESENSLYNTWHFNKLLNELRQSSEIAKKTCYSCPYYEINCNGCIYELEINNILHGKKNPYCPFSPIIDKIHIESFINIQSHGDLHNK